jgi:hypothetical protein
MQHVQVVVCVHGWKSLFCRCCERFNICNSYIINKVLAGKICFFVEQLPGGADGSGTGAGIAGTWLLVSVRFRACGSISRYQATFFLCKKGA